MRNNLAEFGWPQCCLLDYALFFRQRSTILFRQFNFILFPVQVTISVIWTSMTSIFHLLLRRNWDVRINSNPAFPLWEFAFHEYAVKRFGWIHYLWSSAAVDGYDVSLFWQQNGEYSVSILPRKQNVYLGGLGSGETKRVWKRFCSEATLTTILSRWRRFRPY